MRHQQDYPLDLSSPEWKRIYTATLSKTSLQSIAKHCIGETLSGKVVQAVAQNVRNQVSKIVSEGVKFARRTRSPNFNMNHVLFALDEHNIGLDLLHINYAWPEEQEDEEEVPLPLMETPKKKKIKETPSNVESSLPLGEQVLTAPLGTPVSWKKYEQVLLMKNKKFPMSKEQQEFYVLITENCMGMSESSRREALHRLTTDSSLQPMLSKLSLFVGEATKVNVVQQNFALLTYLMRMVHSLLVNKHLQLQKYLHLLIPAVLSCAVARQLCAFPAVQNHWALREFATNIVEEFVKRFHKDSNNIMSRVIKVYQDGLQKSCLTSIYGSLIGLSKLGKYAILDSVIPQIWRISAIIQPHLVKQDSENDLDRQAAIFIRHRLLKMSAPILKNVTQPPDEAVEYARKYGFLGSSLRDAVAMDRIMGDMIKEASQDEFDGEVMKMDS